MFYKLQYYQNKSNLQFLDSIKNLIKNEQKIFELKNFDFSAKPNTNKEQISKEDFLDLSIPNEAWYNIQLHPLTLTQYNKPFKRLIMKNIVKKYNKEILLIFDVTPSINHLKKLSQYYKMIVVVDHHHTLIKNLNEYEKLDQENIIIFYSKKYAASTLMMNFLTEYVFDFCSYIDKEFSDDIFKKLECININDTSFVDDDQICSFIEGIKKLQIEKPMNQQPPNIFKILKYSFSSIQKLGRPMLEEKVKEIDEILKQKKQVIFKIKFKDTQEEQQIQCIGVMINKKIKHISHLGNQLARISFDKYNYGLGMVFSYREFKTIYVSLRSLSDGQNINCERIASSFGGGGHINAAGFQISKKYFQDNFMMKKIIQQFIQN